LIEAWLTRYLTVKDHVVTSIFGEWSFVKNQMAMSPQKPVEYMDFVDLYGTVKKSFLDNHPGTVLKHKLIEVKKDTVTSPEIIGQLLFFLIHFLTY